MGRRVQQRDRAGRHKQGRKSAIFPAVPRRSRYKSDPRSVLKNMLSYDLFNYTMVEVQVEELSGCLPRATRGKIVEQSLRVSV
jgi:hypothetical protein